MDLRSHPSGLWCAAILVPALLILCGFYELICWNQELVSIQMEKHPEPVGEDIIEWPKSTLYDYFGTNITSGLVAEDPEFFWLNGKKMLILSGSLHNFRVPPVYWRDRLRKFRAAGLNTVDVYVPWNLYEPEEGIFDFGSGNRDFSEFLNLTRFLEMIREEDMLAILRPGPYICAEWEFGGLPSWLLKEHPMHLRSSFDNYQSRAERFLKKVIGEVGHLQFYTKEGPRGGPIIAVQIENEFWHSGYDIQPRDLPHLRYLKNVLERSGVESLLFTANDPVAFDKGNVDGVFKGINMCWNVDYNLDLLRDMQPDKPLFVSEFWIGWFSTMGWPWRHIYPLGAISHYLDDMFKRGASVNFYMFHGGTTWGFMNGANVINIFPYYAPEVSNYDYGAPLTESGQYTLAYDIIAQKIGDNDKLGSHMLIPERPQELQPIKYDDVTFSEELRFEDIINLVPLEDKSIHTRPVAMEKLVNLNNGNGQSYGYIVYRKEVPYLKSGSKLKIMGRVHDILTVLVNGMVVNKPFTSSLGYIQFGSWALADAEMTFSLTDVPTSSTGVPVLDLMVENCGRASFGYPHHMDNQFKGIWEGDVLLDGKELLNWQVIPLEFKRPWVEGLTGWRPLKLGQKPDGSFQPRMLKGHLVINDSFSSATSLDGVKHPRDTFFDYTSGNTGWLHGALFVNGFNLGRYFKAGPQRTNYIPGPFLKFGSNQIVIWENYLGQDKLEFSAVPYYGPETALQFIEHVASQFFDVLVNPQLYDFWTLYNVVRLQCGIMMKKLSWLLFGEQGQWWWDQ